MLTEVNPKLPMRDKQITKDFYLKLLGFESFGGDYPNYLMVQKDNIQLHFFEFKGLDPKENYGQVYIRTNSIESLYQDFKNKGVKMTPLEIKPWKQKEFAVLDPDHNLLTFGENLP